MSASHLWCITAVRERPAEKTVLNLHRLANGNETASLQMPSLRAIRTRQDPVQPQEQSMRCADRSRRRAIALVLRC